MKADRVVFRSYGEVSVLEREQVEVRAPGPGEILVDTAFAGINYADVIARRGFYKWAPPPPTCVGFEVSGTVAAVGPGVDAPRLGDRVAAVTRFGGYASRIVLEAVRTYVLPDEMSLEHGAAIPAVYMTAWHSLMEIARVRPGETILIQAVAGGVGLAALELCKHQGLVTYGTASTADKLAFARGRGLDHGIDYQREDFEQAILRETGGRGVDVVLDSLGGEGLRKGYRCLARCGRVVTIGAAQVAPTSRRDPRALLAAGVELVRGGVFHPFQLIEDNRSIAGVQILLLWDDMPRLRRGMDALFALYREGAIRPHVDRVFGIDEIGEAHRLLETRRSKGKLLLRF